MSTWDLVWLLLRCSRVKKKLEETVVVRTSIKLQLLVPPTNALWFGKSQQASTCENHNWTSREGHGVLQGCGQTSSLDISWFKVSVVVTCPRIQHFSSTCDPSPREGGGSTGQQRCPFQSQKFGAKQGHSGYHFYSLWCHPVRVIRPLELFLFTLLLILMLLQLVLKEKG